MPGTRQTDASFLTLTSILVPRRVLAGTLTCSAPSAHSASMSSDAIDVRASRILVLDVGLATPGPSRALLPSRQLRGLIDCAYMRRFCILLR